MAKQSKKKLLSKMIIYGIGTVILYVLLLTNQDLVNQKFTLGGFYALLPIGTAFIFSFIHGNFTSYFWTVIGIEAKKRREIK
ncbi:MAG: hypothetical protein AB1797_02780 [bacterium]